MPYCVGVIGCGRWGLKHIATLLQMKEQGQISHVFACDINPKRLESLPATVDQKFTSWKEMSESVSLDLVTVATPNLTHFLLGQQILSMGVNVLIEKPVATTLGEVKTLCQTSLRHQTHLHSGYLLRYHSVILDAKERIRRGDIGTVRSIRYVKYSPRKKSRRSHIVTGLASHAFDTIPFLVNLRQYPLIKNVATFNHYGASSLNKATRGTVHLQYKRDKIESNVDVEISVGWEMEARFSITLEGTRGTLFLDLKGEGALSIDSNIRAHSTFSSIVKPPPLEFQYTNILCTSELALFNKDSHLATARLIESVVSRMENWRTQYV